MNTIIKITIIYLGKLTTSNTSIRIEWLNEIEENVNYAPVKSNYFGGI